VVNLRKLIRFSRKIKRRRTNKMEWQMIVALVIAIPIILFPVAFIWFINIGGIYMAIKEARARRTAREKEVNKPIKVTNR
jgi:hypothetical protein